MNGLMLGIDSLYASSPAALANVQSSVYLGQTPQFWGRYFYAPGQIDSSGKKDTHYSAAENGFLHNNQIRVAPVARQTGRVKLGTAEAQEDASQNCNAIFEALPASYLATVDPIVNVYLDVEQNSALSSAYYAAWAADLAANSNRLSNGQVALRPAVYINAEDNVSWANLRVAVADGSACFGAWVARYRYGSPVPRAWSPTDEATLLTPTGGTGNVPILAWQYWACADDAAPDLNFDTSIVKPAYSDLFLNGAVMPPAQ